MTIFGVRYCDNEMLRFFSTEEQAREFIAKQDYSPTCYSVEALSEVDFANFVLLAFNRIDAVFQAHRLGGME